MQLLISPATFRSADADSVQLDILSDAEENGVAVTDGHCEIGTQAATTLGLDLEHRRSTKLFNVGQFRAMLFNSAAAQYVLAKGILHMRHDLGSTIRMRRSCAKIAFPSSTGGVACGFDITNVYDRPMMPSRFTQQLAAALHMCMALMGERTPEGKRLFANMVADYTSNAMKTMRDTA